jgi:hypothetical protein
MTDEQIAERMGWPATFRLEADLAARVISLVAAAEATERERCAKLCDELQAEMTGQGTASPYGDGFARRIRAQGAGEPQ